MGRLGLNTGTGGGGIIRYSYELRLYLQDWPLLASKHKEYIRQIGLNEKNRAAQINNEKEYRESRLPSILISDIRYQRLKLELEDAEIALDKAISAKSAAEKALMMRGIFLCENDFKFYEKDLKYNEVDKAYTEKISQDLLLTVPRKISEYRSFFNFQKEDIR